MKIQNLAIIFLVIVIPLIVILSYYLNLQQDTLELQAEYNAKLAEATKEGIKAFEVNTVDWSAFKQDSRKNAESMINTFITSLSNNLHVSGTAKEFMINYIPSIAVTMYDGYYIYAPTYTPVTKENENGIQLYEKSTGIATTEYGEAMLYEAQNGGTTYEYQTVNEDGSTVTIATYPGLTTNIQNAKKEYKHILNNKIAYSAQYTRETTPKLNVIINYTLDNHIYVYGTINNKNINKDGYLVYFDNNSEMPRAFLNTNNPQDDSNIIVDKGVKTTKYNNTSIETEILKEQIIYVENGTPILHTFKYIYDIDHLKLYYDEIVDNFFTIKSSTKERVFLDNSTNITLGSDGCKYKSISILWGNSNTTSEYKKIYQVLNGKDKGEWYINIKEDSEETKKEGTEEIDTEIKSERLSQLGLDDIQFATIYRDYSAISYYVEAFAFTNWARQNLLNMKRTVYNETTNQYENVTIENIFDITKLNDPEKIDSSIVIHKKEIMKENIITNLNLAISNYNRSGEYGFKLPVLTDSDWEQVFSNISLITFFQGIPIGLKYYNNYAIATSTTNREYVDPGEIYLSGEDINYHRVYCEKCKNVIYTGYRSVEYVLKEYITEMDKIYYYEHDDVTSTNSETACYYCVVNKANYNKLTDSSSNPEKAEITYKQAKSYNEALARERYYQNEKLKGKLGVVIKYHYNIEGKTDITDKGNLPPDQEVEIGVSTAISSQEPWANTDNPYIKYKFIGWSKTEGASTLEEVDYEAGDVDVFYENTDLYAVWRLSLVNLPWKYDYRWEGIHNKPILVLPGFAAPQQKWSQPGYNDYISCIKITEENVVQMKGNNCSEGKGAAWTTLEAEYLDIQTFKFSYNINVGHSFGAGGFMFNVSETGDENSGFLEGYLISINFSNFMFEKAGNKTGAIFKFKWEKNKNECHIGTESTDYAGITQPKDEGYLELVQSFNIPGINSGKNATDNGEVTINITENGYEIIMKLALFTQTFNVSVPEDEINPNSFGFFSDHFGRNQGHACDKIGSFRLSNIEVITTYK